MRSEEQQVDWMWCACGVHDEYTPFIQFWFSSTQNSATNSDHCSYGKMQRTLAEGAEKVW